MEMKHRDAEECRQSGEMHCAQAAVWALRGQVPGSLP